MATTYIINRLPTTYLKNKCLFEVLYNRKPTYFHLRSFSCLCFSTTPKIHKDKFEPKTTSHVLVVYPYDSKRYKVLNLATKKIHVSRDVIFHKNNIPFGMLPDASSAFPSVFNYVPCVVDLSSGQLHSVDSMHSPLEATSDTSNTLSPGHTSTPPTSSLTHPLPS